jgi:hypothetical protein
MIPACSDAGKLIAQFMSGFNDSEDEEIRHNLVE